MALQTNLNKKDKMTIAILLFSAAIFMIIWFLIRPTITSIATINDKNDQAQLEQTTYKNKIIYLSSAGALYDKAVDDLNASTADYYEIMDSSEIDKMVTSYVLKSGLFSENLVINMPKEAVDEIPYAYADIPDKNYVNTGDISENENDSADTLITPYVNARNSVNSTQSSGVQCVGLTLVVTGTRSACQAFIDDISSKPAVRITSFAWEPMDKIEQYDSETGAVTYLDPGTIRLRITLNLYMADVKDYGTAASVEALGSEG